MQIYNCKTQRLICYASCIIRAGSLKDSHAQPVMCLIIVIVRQVSRPNCEDIQGVKDVLKWPQNEQSEWCKWGPSMCDILTHKQGSALIWFNIPKMIDTWKSNFSERNFAKISGWHRAWKVTNKFYELCVWLILSHWVATMQDKTLLIFICRSVSPLELKIQKLFSLLAPL